MKKIILTLLVLTTSHSFSQNISSPSPIITYFDSTTSTWLPLNNDVTLSSGQNIQLQASWTNIGSTDTYIVESIPFNPKPYLSATGTTITQPNIGFKLETLSDDMWSSINSLSSNGSDFNFSFFGNSYAQFVISSNNIVSFDISYANGYSNWATNTMGKIFPNADCGDNKATIIMMSDLYALNSETLFDSYSFWDINGDTGERYFIMGLHHMPMYLCGGNVGYATYQMVFYETTNIIEFHLQDKPICDTWNGGNMATGIQNSDLTQGYTLPGRDNLDQYQILDLNDGFYDSNINANFPVEAPESWRLVPDGNLGTAPTFAWYTNWDSATNTGTFVSNNPSINLDGTDIPAGEEVVYTAVITYTNYLTGDVYYARNVVNVYDENYLKTNDNQLLDFNIQPNPAKDNVIISFADIQAKVTVQVYTILGNRVLSQQFFNKKALSLDVSTLDKGVYFINTLADGKTNTKKLIIK